MTSPCRSENSVLTENIGTDLLDGHAPPSMILPGTGAPAAAPPAPKSGTKRRKSSTSRSGSIAEIVVSQSGSLRMPNGEVVDPDHLALRRHSSAKLKDGTSGDASSRRGSVVPGSPQPPAVPDDDDDPRAEGNLDGAEGATGRGSVRRVPVLKADEVREPPFESNYIKTSKYTTNPASLDFFLWKNLYEQFKRKANIYFLIIGGLQLIPGLSPTGQFTTLSTLCAVLFFSMVKAAFEDYQRHRKDVEVNSRPAYVLREVEHHGRLEPRFVQVPYTEVRVGDVVRVFNIDSASTGTEKSRQRNNAIPCDLLLLSSSDAEGFAYLETSNLDGETNLKPRHCLERLRLPIYRPSTHLDDDDAGFGSSAADHDPSSFFSANQPGGSNGVSTDDFAAATAVSPERKSTRLSTAQQAWLKYNKLVIECEEPNGNLYTFAGNVLLPDGKLNISPNNVLYRGSSLRKVSWVIGVSLFTGKETKVMMNARKPPHKTSHMESLVNWLLIAVLALQFVMVLTCAVVLTILPGESNAWYLRQQSQSAALTFIFGFITFLILFNNLIPISLYVTLELIKFFQGRFLEWDLCMYYAAKDMPAAAKTTDLNEELGQINYIFSDKTGTLTQNVMTFMKFFCNGKTYGTGVTEIGRAAAKRRGEVVVDARPEEVLQSDFPFYDARLSDGRWWNDASADSVRRFFTLLSVCHTVIIDQGRFEAESPDEDALVKAAAKLGVRFASRRGESVILEIGAAMIEESVEVLETIAFDSDRKRMSVLVKLPKGGGYRLMTKGADNVMLPRLDPISFTHQEEQARQALKAFGEEGLRVLVLAERVIPEPEALRFATAYRSAKEIVGDDVRRAAAMAALADTFEIGYEFVGISAIEDKLQEGVADALESFRAGGVQTWMLTGDKVETAINIGFACSLLFTDCRLGTYVGVTDRAEMLGYFAKELEGREAEHTALIEAGSVSTAPQPTAVVIDGDSLHTVLNDEELRPYFYAVIRDCVSVICCRVSPRQKAQVVALMREYDETAVTLSIGDGANDVPMIQSAHVGVGISGMEGQQAANAADYAIGQFRFLQRLLLVHGRANYHRLATTINYFFYKNALLVMTQFWFCIFNRFTGQSLYEKWTLSGYNVAFTAVAVIAYGVLDRDVLNTDKVKGLPQLFRLGIQSESLNPMLFISWVATALVHSLGIFFVIMFGWGGDGINSKGFTGGLDTLGLTIMGAVIIVANAKLALHTNSFTWIHHLFIWGSIVFFFAFCVVYSVFPSTFSTSMYDNVTNILSWFSPWVFMMLAVAIVLLPDFFVLYGAYQLTTNLSLRRTVQHVDSLDPMASVRPPLELKRKKKSAVIEATSPTDDAPPQVFAESNYMPADEEMSPTNSDPADPTADKEPLSKDGLFQKSAATDDDDIDTTQDMLLQFMDMDLEAAFLQKYVGRLMRYKIAIALGAVASLLLVAASANSYATNGVVEPAMWGIFAVVAWACLIALMCTKISINGRLHSMLLVLMVVGFMSLSIANLLSSRRDASTHPVTLCVILLGLLTVVRPPLVHALQYSIIAIVAFVTCSFVIRVKDWTRVDLVMRAVEFIIVIITSTITLYLSESFSRRMFVSQLMVQIAHRAARREEKRSLLLLGNVLPSAIVQDVRRNKRHLSQFSIRYESASTLNSDIVKFTNFSSTKEPHVVVEMLNKMFTLFDADAKRLRLEKIKTIGDAYVCASGIPIRDPRHKEKIILMGTRMIENVHVLNRQGLTTLRDLDIHIRVGVSSGGVGAGVVGLQKVCYEVFGECPEMSELMEQTGRPDMVHVHASLMCDTTRALYEFVEIDGEYFVSNVKPDSGFEHLFDISADNTSAEGVPFADLNRQDIYTFLEDEDEERRITLQLWANFSGDTQWGALRFRSDMAEMEYSHYVRLLAQNRLSPEGAQGAYLFIMSAVLLSLHYRSPIHAYMIIAIVVGLLHVAVAVGNAWLRDHRRKQRESGIASGSADADREGDDSPASPVGGGMTEGGDSDLDDEAVVSRNLVHVQHRRSTAFKASGAADAQSAREGRNPVAAPALEGQEGSAVEAAEGADQQLYKDVASTFDPTNVNADISPSICSPIRGLAFASALAALALPIVLLLVFPPQASVMAVFVVLAVQCYVLSMLHTRIIFKIITTLAHFAAVSGAFFYTTVSRGDWNNIKDGGNYFAIVMCYILTFLSAFITEQNVRKSFAAGKNVLYQNAETQSAVALCDKILNNVLPRQIVKRMKEFPDKQIVDEVGDASVLFIYTDGLKPHHHEGDGKSMTEIIGGINAFLWILDAITVRNGVEKIKTAPFLVVSGCPQRNTDHPQRLAEVAREVMAAIDQFNYDTQSDFKLKIGIHTGKVTAGVLGSTKFLYDVFGDTVNFASRLTSSADWGAIQVSGETARRLRPLGYKLTSIGVIELKGKGKQEVFLLGGRDKPPSLGFRAAGLAAIASNMAMSANGGGGGGKSPRGMKRVEGAAGLTTTNMKNRSASNNSSNNNNNHNNSTSNNESFSAAGPPMANSSFGSNSGGGGRTGGGGGVRRRSRSEPSSPLGAAGSPEPAPMLHIPESHGVDT